MGRRLPILVAVSLLAFAGSALAGKGDPKHAFTPAGRKLAKSIVLTMTRALPGVGDKATLITLNTTATQGKLRLPFVVHVGAINKGAVDALFIAANLGAPYAGTQALIARLASRMP